MSACFYRVSKEKCMWKYEMEFAAFLGNFGYAHHVIGSTMVDCSFSYVVRNLHLQYYRK